MPADPTAFDTGTEEHEQQKENAEEQVVRGGSANESNKAKRDQEIQGETANQSNKGKGDSKEEVLRKAFEQARLNPTWKTWKDNFPTWKKWIDDLIKEENEKQTRDATALTAQTQPNDAEKNNKAKRDSKEDILREAFERARMDATWKTWKDDFPTWKKWIDDLIKEENEKQTRGATASTAQSQPNNDEDPQGESEVLTPQQVREELEKLDPNYISVQTTTSRETIGGKVVNREAFVHGNAKVLVLEDGLTVQHSISEEQFADIYGARAPRNREHHDPSNAEDIVHGSARRSGFGEAQFGEAYSEYSTWMVAIKRVTTDMELNQRNYLQQLIQEFTPIDRVREYFSTSWPETLFHMLTFKEEDTEAELNDRFMEMQSVILQDQSCNISQFCIPQVPFTPNIFLQMTDKHPTDTHKPHEGFHKPTDGYWESFTKKFFKTQLRENYYIRPMFCDKADSSGSKINSRTLENLNKLQQQASKGGFKKAYVTSPRVDNREDTGCLQDKLNVRPYHWTSCATQPNLLYMIPMIGDMPTRRTGSVDLRDMVSNNQPGNSERWLQRRLKTFDNYNEPFTVQLTNYYMGAHTYQAALFRSIREFKSWIFKDVAPCRMKTNDLLWVFKGRNHEHEGTIVDGKLELKPRYPYRDEDQYKYDHYAGLSDTCTIQAHFGFFKLREGQEFVVKELFQLEAPLDDHNVSGHFVVIVLFVDGIRVPIFCETGASTQVKENAEEEYVAGIMAALRWNEIQRYKQGPKTDETPNSLPDQTWYRKALDHAVDAKRGVTFLKDMYDTIARSTLTDKPVEEAGKAAAEVGKAAAEVGKAALKEVGKAALKEGGTAAVVSNVGKEVAGVITRSQAKLAEAVVEKGTKTVLEKGTETVVDLGTQAALSTGTTYALKTAPSIGGKIGALYAAGKTGVYATATFLGLSPAAVLVLGGLAVFGGITYLNYGSLPNMFVSTGASAMHAYSFQDTYGNTFEQLAPNHMRKKWMEFWAVAYTWYPTQVSKPTVHVIRHKGRIALAIKRNGEVVHRLDPVYTHPLTQKQREDGSEPETSPFFINDCIIRTAYSSDLLILLVKTGEEILKHLYIRRTCQILAGWIPVDDEQPPDGYFETAKSGVNYLFNKITGPNKNPFKNHQKPYPGIKEGTRNIDNVINEDFIKVLTERGFRFEDKDKELLTRDLRKVLNDQVDNRTESQIGKEMLETAQSTALSNIEDEVAQLFSFRDQTSTLSQDTAKRINKMITKLIMEPVYLNKSLNKDTNKHEHWGHTVADVLSSICRTEKIKACLETNVFDDEQPVENLTRTELFNIFQNKPAGQSSIAQMLRFFQSASADRNYEPVSELKILDEQFSEKTVDLSHYHKDTIGLLHRAQLDILRAMIYTVTPPVKDTEGPESIPESIPWFAWACEYFVIVQRQNSPPPEEEEQTTPFGNITI